MSFRDIACSLGRVAAISGMLLSAAGGGTLVTGIADPLFLKVILNAGLFLVALSAYIAHYCEVTLPTPAVTVASKAKK